MIRNFFIALFVWILAVPAAAQETQIVAGAGPSTRVVALFFKEFSKHSISSGYKFSVPLKSTKHHGGIENTNSYLFGRTGRPLNPSELALNKGEIYLAMVPITFVAGHGVPLQSISMRDLEMIYSKQITNWRKLGGPDAPITTVGREQSEALFSELKNHYSFFRQAKFDKIFHRDHEVIAFLRSPEGRHAIAFGAAPNFYLMNIIYVKDGLQAGVRVGLVYDHKNVGHQLVKAVREYAVSEEWRDIVKKSRYGLIPIN